MHDFHLVLEFAKNDFKLRFKNSYFGYIWSIVNPLLMLITLYIVFSYVMQLDVPHYQLFLLLGIIIWNYFSDATSHSIVSFESHSSILKGHKIKPYLIVLSSCLSSMFQLGINALIFLGMMLFFNVQIPVISLLSIFYIVFLFIFTFGSALCVSGIYILFKDIKHIWSFVLLIGFWISPIIYSEHILHQSIRKYYMLNPIARIISHFRNVFIYNHVDNIQQIIITIIICVIVLFMGFFIFNKTAHYYGEKI